MYNNIKLKGTTLIKQIKDKVLKLKIKENIKEVLSLDELEYLNSTDDNIILEKVNKYIINNVIDYTNEVDSVVLEFIKDYNNYNQIEECFHYYIEKHKFFTEPNKEDKLDLFIDALKSNKMLCNKLKQDLFYDRIDRLF